MAAVDAGLAALLGATIGGLLGGGAAVGAQVWASHSQANVAKEAYLQQDRVWHRDQRLEAHHMFLNQVNRLVHALAAVVQAKPDDPNHDALIADVAEVLARTVDAYNRVELVGTEQTHDLAIKILLAADAERLRKPEEFPSVQLAIAEASRTYREAVKTELRA